MLVFERKEKACTALECWGKLSTLKRPTLSILLLNIKRKRNGTDLFEEYSKKGNLNMREGVIM